MLITKQQPEKGDEGSKWRFDIGVPYEFTINFNDEYQESGRLPLRYKFMRKILRTIFDENTGVSYALVPELTTPQYGDKSFNARPRFHYHGLLSFDDEEGLLKWLIQTSVLCARVGRYQFNPYRKETWPDYCVKQWHLMRHLSDDVDQIILANNQELEDMLLGGKMIQ